MVGEDVVVDGVKSVLAGEAECKHVEMTQESRINGEAAGGRIHTWQVLGVMNLFQCQLGPVVPVSVVQVLSNQRVRLNGEVRIYLLTTANTALSYYEPRRLVV